jgi:hypothetical protein
VSVDLPEPLAPATAVRIGIALDDFTHYFFAAVFSNLKLEFLSVGFFSDQFFTDHVIDLLHESIFGTNFQ